VLRVGGVLASVALAVVLSAGVARATSDPFGGARPDLGSQLMLRLFGETSDTVASFAAERGDRTSESPLRELALALPVASERSAYVTGIASTPLSIGDSAQAPGGASLSDLSRAFDAGFIRGDARLAPASPASDNFMSLEPSNPLLTAAYKPVTPAPNISPEPGTLAFGPPVTASFSSGDSLSAVRSAVFVPPTGRVGGVQFESKVEGTSLQTPQLSLNDNSYGAGANFQLRAGKRDVNLNLTTQYENVARNDSSSFSASTLNSASSWQLPGAGLPFVSNHSDLNRFSVGAGLDVPLVRGLSLNLNYSTQRLFGGYGLPGLVNLDQVNNSYGGRLTFDIPNSSKTLSISAYQQHFTDNILPLNGSTQLREDVNFTVKF
jgi:hypothetical protein